MAHGTQRLEPRSPRRRAAAVLAAAALTTLLLTMPPAHAQAGAGIPQIGILELQSIAPTLDELATTLQGLLAGGRLTPEAEGHTRDALARVSEARGLLADLLANPTAGTQARLDRLGALLAEARDLLASAAAVAGSAPLLDGLPATVGLADLAGRLDGPAEIAREVGFLTGAEETVIPFFPGFLGGAAAALGCLGAFLWLRRRAPA